MGRNRLVLTLVNQQRIDIFVAILHHPSLTENLKINVTFATTVKKSSIEDKMRLIVGSAIGCPFIINQFSVTAGILKRVKIGAMTAARRGAKKDHE